MVKIVRIFSQVLPSLRSALITMNIKTESIYKKLLKMPGWEAYVDRPRGLLKEGWSTKP